MLHLKISFNAFENWHMANESMIKLINDQIFSYKNILKIHNLSLWPFVRFQSHTDMLQIQFQIKNSRTEIKLNIINYTIWSA